MLNILRTCYPGLKLILLAILWTPFSVVFSKTSLKPVFCFFPYSFKTTISIDLAPSAYQIYVSFSHIKMFPPYLLTGNRFISSIYFIVSPTEFTLSFLLIIYSPLNPAIQFQPPSLHQVCFGEGHHTLLLLNPIIPHQFFSYLCSNRPYWLLSPWNSPLSWLLWSYTFLIVFLSLSGFSLKSCFLNIVMFLHGCVSQAEEDDMLGNVSFSPDPVAPHIPVVLDLEV